MSGKHERESYSFQCDIPPLTKTERDWLLSHAPTKDRRFGIRVVNREELLATVIQRIHEMPLVKDTSNPYGQGLLAVFLVGSLAEGRRAINDIDLRFVFQSSPSELQRTMVMWYTVTNPLYCRVYYNLDGEATALNPYDNDRRLIPFQLQPHELLFNRGLSDSQYSESLKQVKEWISARTNR